MVDLEKTMTATHSALQHLAHPTGSGMVRILGYAISDYSRHLVEELARQAHLSTVHITSVTRTVEDQARIFYKKHVVEKKKAVYKNPEVSKIIAHARELRTQG